MEHDVHAQQRIVVGERSPQETTDASELVVRTQAGDSYLEGQGMKEHEMISAITLRDYFAAQAMQAIRISSPHTSYPDLAKSAYILAEEMLKAREE